MLNMEKQTHESFGQIRFSRVQGKQNFYGSELEQSHFITMEIHHSQVQKDLSSEYYFPTGIPIVALRMTSGQFAEMITSMNYGSGVCCTLELINGQKVEDMPTQESRKEFVHRKFEDRMKEFGDTIRERQKKAQEIVKKKTLSKADIHELTHHLEWLTGEVELNIPFFAKQFQENMDEVVLEAKTEVENAIQHRINVLGLAALKEDAKNLLTDNSEKK